MKQNTTNLSSQTIGLDLGDKRSVAFVLAPSGDVLEEIKLQTTRASLDSAFGTRPACRIALEVGTHSAWIAEQLSGYGHEVIVANPPRCISFRAVAASRIATTQRPWLDLRAWTRNCCRRFNIASRMHVGSFFCCVPALPWSLRPRA